MQNAMFYVDISLMRMTTACQALDISHVPKKCVMCQGRTFQSFTTILQQLVLLSIAIEKLLLHLINLELIR